MDGRGGGARVSHCAGVVQPGYVVSTRVRAPEQNEPVSPRLPTWRVHEEFLDARTVGVAVRDGHGALQLRSMQ